MSLEYFLEYKFKEHSAFIQLVLFAGIWLSLWFAEVLVSVHQAKLKWKHGGINLLFILTAVPVQLGMTLLVLGVSEWVRTHHWGILFLFDGNTFVKYLCGFLLLDFFEYVYHVIMHKVYWLWRFHLVHHSDYEVDVSTTIREHPGETFVRVSFLCLWVFLSGATFGLLILRQTVQTISNISAHTHLQLPEKTAKVIGWLFITPNLHHVHHHNELPYTDSNFGDVLSIWDRLFGTYKEKRRPAINYGVDVFRVSKSTGFFSLIAAPFSKRKFKTTGKKGDTGKDYG